MKSGAKAIFPLYLFLALSCGAQDIKQNYARDSYKSIPHGARPQDTQRQQMSVVNPDTHKGAQMPVLKPDTAHQAPMPVLKPQPGVQSK